MEQGDRARAGCAGAWYTLGHAYNAVAQKRRPLSQTTQRSSRGVSCSSPIDWLAPVISRTPSRSTEPFSCGCHRWCDARRCRGHLRAHRTSRLGRPGAWPRRTAAKCVRQRRALCEFRAGRHAAALTAALATADAESRYWRARAAGELARETFRSWRSFLIPRNGARARHACAGRGSPPGCGQGIRRSVELAPGNPVLTFELAAACHAASDFERALATLAPLLETRPQESAWRSSRDTRCSNCGGQTRPCRCSRRASAADPGDRGAQLALGRAHLQRGDFAAAIPLLERAPRHRRGRQPARPARARIHGRRPARQGVRAARGRRRCARRRRNGVRRRRGGRSRRRSKPS